MTTQVLPSSPIYAALPVALVHLSTIYGSWPIPMDWDAAQTSPVSDTSNDRSTPTTKGRQK